MGEVHFKISNPQYSEENICEENLDINDCILTSNYSETRNYRASNAKNKRRRTSLDHQNEKNQDINHNTVKVENLKETAEFTDENNTELMIPETGDICNKSFIEKYDG